MNKLTRAQKKFINYVETHNSPIFFTRDKYEKERCYMGRKRINARVFFFLYAEIEYLELDFREDKKNLQYWYMRPRYWKLAEWLQRKK